MGGGTFSKLPRGEGGGEFSLVMGLLRQVSTLSSRRAEREKKEKVMKIKREDFCGKGKHPVTNV